MRIDLGHVLVEHQAIHDRLENWAAWCRPGKGRQVSPMFRLYRPDNYDRPVRSDARIVNTGDALKIQKLIPVLPMPQRTAIAWCYCWRGYPSRIKRKLGVSDAGLLDLLHSGRQLLTLATNP